MSLVFPDLSSPCIVNHGLIFNQWFNGYVTSRRWDVWGQSQDYKWRQITFVSFYLLATFINEVNYDLKSFSITYLKISLSQSLYPSNWRFFAVAFLWCSLRPVSINTVNPSCFSSLYKFRLACKAGASAKSTHSSKDNSSKGSDLWEKHCKLVDIDQPVSTYAFTTATKTAYSTIWNQAVPGTSLSCST